jgi:hypothetical protein
VNIDSVKASISPSGMRTIRMVDGHRDDGQRFVVRADEKLTAFVELESAIQARELLDLA